MSGRPLLSAWKASEVGAKAKTNRVLTPKASHRIDGLAGVPPFPTPSFWVPVGLEDKSHQGA